MFFVHMLGAFASKSIQQTSGQKPQEEKIYLQNRTAGLPSSKNESPSKIEWDLPNGPLTKLLELLDTKV